MADPTIHQDGLMPMSIHINRHSPRSRIIRQGLAIIAGNLMTTSIAHAHGGMASTDELGPPLFTSVALAFVCYWLVILWPASKRKGTDDAPRGEKMLSDEQRRAAKRAHTRAAPRQNAQLRKLEGKRARSKSGRKASDA